MSVWRKIPEFKNELANCKPLMGTHTSKEKPPIWVQHKHDASGHLIGTFAVLVWRGKAIIAGALPNDKGSHQHDFTRAIGRNIATGRVLKAMAHEIRKRALKRVKLKGTTKKGIAKMKVLPPRGHLATILEFVPDPRVDEFVFTRAPGAYRDVWTIAVRRGGKPREEE